MAVDQDGGRAGKAGGGLMGAGHPEPLLQVQQDPAEGGEAGVRMCGRGWAIGKAGSPE